MNHIANMLQSIKSGSRAGHDVIMMPASSMTKSIAECLVRAGFVKSVDEKTQKGHPILVVELAYADDKSPKVSDVSLVSKPSRRMYMGVKGIRPVKNGHGVLIMSTPKGVLSGSEAKKEQVGGEIIAKVW
jgi:small subunit ribosomal protein S8